MMSSFNSAYAFASSDAGGAPPIRRRWGWLAASIALNLLLVGLILAWVLSMESHQPYINWQTGIISSLSPSDAAIVKKSIQRILDVKAEGDLSVHAQQEKLHAALKDEPLDKPAVTQMMDNIAKTRIDQSAAINDAFLEELTTLSADGRFKVQAVMEQQWNRWRPPQH